MIEKKYSLLASRKIFVNDNFKDCMEFVKELPTYFKNKEGKVIHEGRNELREFHYKGKDLVVKSFCKPNLINQIAYGLLRSSKAQRSYEYAEMLLQTGIGSPTPVAYFTERQGLLFNKSYYVSLKSECPYTYNDLLKQHFDNEEAILRAIAATTAEMHERGYLHKDYSRGNILFRETPEGIKVEIIDLNRIRFKQISMEEGCKNFERLPGKDEWWKIMSETYAERRGFDAKTCYQLICQAIENCDLNK